MEKLVRVDTKIINKCNPDKFSLQRVLKDSRAGYEYLVDGVWRAEPPQKKPDGTRVVFEINQFRVAKDAYFAWQNITTQRDYQPVFPEEIVKRLFNARLTNAPLTLFTPWGFRPQGIPGAEKQVFNLLQSFKTMLTEKNIPSQILIMPADLYATEVNKMDQKQTDDYFNFITDLAKSQEFSVKAWSVIRSEYFERYSSRKKELETTVIDEIIGDVKISEALNTAKRRSGYASQDEIE